MDVKRQLGIIERTEGVIGSTRLKAVGPAGGAARNSLGSGSSSAKGSSGGSGRLVGFHGGRSVFGGHVVGVGKVVDGRKGRRMAAGRCGVEPRVRREPAAAQCFLSTALVSDGGRAPRAGPAVHPGGVAGAPRVPSQTTCAVGQERTPALTGQSREGWLGAADGRMRPESGAEAVGASSSRRRGPRRPVRSWWTAVFFWERTRASRSVFPEGVLGSEKLKTHFRVEVGFGCGC